MYDKKRSWKCRFAKWIWNRLHKWEVWHEYPIGVDAGDGLMKQIGTFNQIKCRACGQVVSTAPDMYGEA